MCEKEQVNIEQILNKCKIYTLKCGIPDINLALISGKGNWEDCFILLQIDGHTHVLGVEPPTLQGDKAPIRKLYIRLHNFAESKESIEFIPLTTMRDIRSLPNLSELVKTIMSYVKIGTK